MTDVKARFLIATEASIDGKTTVYKVKQIQLEDMDEVFAFPPELQDIALHDELMKTGPAKSAKRVLTTRNTYRNPFIRLTTDLKKIYLDEDGNPSFKGELLAGIFAPSKEEVKPLILPTNQPVTNAIPATKSLSTILKDAVIEKFNGRNYNAVSWLNTLEDECTRLQITEENYWIVIRLFLEGPASDWYQATRTILKTDIWEQWRQSFLNAFSSKGWSDVCSALYYRFTAGSLTDYALKKLKMLVDMDPRISDNMKICTIVAGLPPSVREKLDRGEIDSVNTLFSKINVLDKPQRQNGPNNNYTNNNHPKGPQNKPFNNFRTRTPCPYCEKKGYIGRMHAESECRTKAYDLSRNGNAPNNNKITPTYAYAAKTGMQPQNKTVKLVNNTELEEIIAIEQNQKN